MNKTKNVKPISFAAVNPYRVDNIVSSVEVEDRKNGYMNWGEQNQFPEYLHTLFESVPTLATIINGSTDYVVGNDVAVTRGLQGDKMNLEGETIEDIVEQLARDYFTYGGFALQVIRTKDLSEIAEIYAIPLRYLRSDKDGQDFVYSEDWGNKFSRKANLQHFPKFSTGIKHPTSILYVKNVRTQTYPIPLYMAALLPCEIEKSINTFHLNSIKNGFVGSYIVNFNNGQPDDEIKDQIEKEFNAKFTGEDNAGNVMLAWNDSKENAVNLEKMEIADFGEKYNTLAKRSEQQIFISFRATPNLFGIASENNGFNNEEYAQTFKLFNRTMIRPVQKRIITALNKALGEGNEVSIQPFTLENTEE